MAGLHALCRPPNYSDLVSRVPTIPSLLSGAARGSPLAFSSSCLLRLAFKYRARPRRDSQISLNGRAARERTRTISSVHGKRENSFMMQQQSQSRRQQPRGLVAPSNVNSSFMNRRHALHDGGGLLIRLSVCSPSTHIPTATVSNRHSCHGLQQVDQHGMSSASARVSDRENDLLFHLKSLLY